MKRSYRVLLSETIRKEFIVEALNDEEAFELAKYIDFDSGNETVAYASGCRLEHVEEIK